MQSSRGERCRHHLVNRSKGGSNHVSNRVLLYVHKEQLIHLLFGNANQYQILRQLRRMNKNGALTEYIKRFERLIRAKEYQAKEERQTTGTGG